MAGLNKIRVSLEETGRMMDVSKSEVALMTSTTIIETSPAPPQYFGLMREETHPPPLMISLLTNPPAETANITDK